jgi:hypothetical protein
MDYLVLPLALLDRKTAKILIPVPMALVVTLPSIVLLVSDVALLPNSASCHLMLETHVIPPAVLLALLIAIPAITLANLRSISSPPLMLSSHTGRV